MKWAVVGRRQKSANELWRDRYANTGRFKRVLGHFPMEEITLRLFSQLIVIKNVSQMHISS